MSNIRTPQQVFDRVVAHAREQRRPSITRAPTFRATNAVKCLYRAPDGAKCFVGALIKDEFYYAGLERRLVPDQEVQKALLKSGVPVLRRLHDRTDYTVLHMLNRLQVVHDSNVAVPDATEQQLQDMQAKWANGLQGTAEFFGLTYTPPTEQV